MKLDLCLRCMAPLGEDGRCPRCGGDNGDLVSLPHQLPPGSILNNRYLVGRVLGEGGFGITYMGFDLALELKVAIKEYYPAGFVSRDVNATHFVSSVTVPGGGNMFENGKQKCMNEAKTMAKLDELREVVRVRDYFLANNTAYIIMDFVEGVTLKDCDLRSTLFMRCRFVDVTLEDCLTHGLLFIDCEFEGTFTVRSTGTNNGLQDPDKLKTLTFGFGCRTADDDSKVLVEGMAGYGLFFDGYVGRWEVSNSTFSHLVVNGSHHTGDDGVERACGPGRIVDSPAVRHVVIGGEPPHKLLIAGVDHTDGPRLDAPAYLEAPGIDVIYERGEAVP